MSRVCLSNKKHNGLLHKKYHLPEKKFNQITNKNLNHLLFIEPVLLIFNLVFFLLIFAKNIGHLENERFYLIYYLGNTINSLLVIILSLISKKFPQKNPRVRTIPLILAVFVYLLTCSMCYVHLEGKLNCFIIIACITTASLLFFDFYPPFYIASTNSSILVIFAYSIIQPTKVLPSNLLIFILIVDWICIYRWRLIVQDYKTSSILSEHSKNLDKELKLASSIQKTFYRKDLSQLKDYKISVYSKAMAGVSGDGYAVYLEENHLDGLCIYDVSGHGISSGLVTMIVRNTIEKAAKEYKDIPFDEVLTKVDSEYRSSKAGIENFFTGIFLRVSRNADYLEFINAGHPKPLLYRKKTNEVSLFDEENKYQSSIIGLNNYKAYFNTARLEMNKGDELVLFTDGITEAQNQEHKQFGKLRLLETFKKMDKKDTDNQIQEFIRAYTEYTEGTPVTDDLTILIIKKL